MGACGHKLKGSYAALALKAVEHDFATDGLVNVVSHVVFCKPCARRMRKIGMVLETVEEEHDWLTRPLC